MHTGVHTLPPISPQQGSWSHLGSGSRVYKVALVKGRTRWPDGISPGGRVASMILEEAGRQAKRSHQTGKHFSKRKALGLRSRYFSNIQATSSQKTSLLPFLSALLFLEDFDCILLPYGPKSPLPFPTLPSGLEKPASTAAPSHPLLCCPA